MSDAVRSNGREDRNKVMNDILQEQLLQESHPGARRFLEGMQKIDWNKAASGVSPEHCFALEHFPPHARCVGCGGTLFSLSHLGMSRDFAIWKCQNCSKDVLVRENWLAFVETLQDAGVADDEIESVKASAIRNKVSAAVAAKQHLQERQELIVSRICPPPDRCPKCAEFLWTLQSASPNLKSASWICDYCARAEVVRADDDTEAPERDSGRPSIPKEVQREVWRRDQGRCSQCGSNERLEFDHIIARSRGGADTARNIQLLCEECNRRKSDKSPGSE